MPSQHPLPQMSDALFLTDGGLETTLIFHDGLDLPCFASFDLLKDDAGTGRLRRYYQQYIDYAPQIRTLVDAGAEMISVFTLPATE